MIGRFCRCSASSGLEVTTVFRIAPQGTVSCSVGTFRNRFYKEIEKIPDVRKLSPHCCRHTYVTMLQAEGVPMETIAALTGHSDIKTTAGYLHQSADTLAKAVEVLNGKAAS